LRSHDDVRTWYETTIINRYFDEVHELKSLDVSIEGERADVRVVTRWQARRWPPPAPRSERIDFVATQTWVVECLPGTARPVIKKYVVDEFVPSEGSVPL
jgi:wyosine [tRNA(Phe)-imidazoG37] synthetase (radical SAM superfamily)